jgi:tRNA(Ile)-lysidine synthase
MELPGYLKMICNRSLCTFALKQDRTGATEIDVPVKGKYVFPASAITLKFALANKRRAPDPAIAQLDADKATFPLYIRNWKKGDSFRPLGMKGTKKLSDYFIDKKIPRSERKRIPLVYKDDDLIWVSGYQIDDKYKVTRDTKRVLIIEARKND